MKATGPVHPLVIFSGLPGELEDIRLLAGLADESFRLSLAIPASLFASPWHASVPDGLIGGDLLATMQDKARKGTLSFLPCGWRGCWQGILLEAELEVECAWSLRNPWRTGLQDLDLDTGEPWHFNWPDHARLSPLTGDRPCLEGLFQEGSNPAMVMFRSGQNRGTLEFLGNGRDVQPTGVEVLLLADSMKPGMARELERLATEYRHAGIPTAAHLDAARFQPWHKPEPATLSPFRGQPSAGSPQLGANLARLGQLRDRGRPGDEGTRDALNLAFPLPTGPAPLGGTGVHHQTRTHLASMQGHVTMPSTGYGVLFHGGTLKGLAMASSTIDCPVPPRVELRSAHDSRRFETLSGVSLEAPSVRGLRETKILRGFGAKDAFVHLDYLLSEGSDLLLIESTLHMPVLAEGKALSELNPLSLFFRLGDNVRVSWRAGGMPRTLALAGAPAPTGVQAFMGGHASGDWIHLRGSDWQFLGESGGIACTVPGLAVNCVALRMHRDRKGDFLELAPLGIWDNLVHENLSGRKLVLSCALLPIAAELEGPLDLPHDWPGIVSPCCFAGPC